jgi:mannose-6-phosphate isomerase
VWCAFEGSRVQNGPHTGQTVGELTEQHGETFVGTVAASRFPSRFPLLVKLLDCADWLSVQVHPNDEQAARLVGHGQFGKTEAWHFLQVQQGAAILAGVKPGTTPQNLETAIRSGAMLDVAQRIEVRDGETYLLPAGTLHALGPGLLLYELQQASDTTYRVYDWDRPTSLGRRLHIEEALLVADSQTVVRRTSPPARHGSGITSLTTCPYFSLDLIRIGDAEFAGDSGGRTFSVLTATEGVSRITSGEETTQLERFETALIAGSAGAWTLEAIEAPATVLRATLPGGHDFAGSDQR